MAEGEEVMQAQKSGILAAEFGRTTQIAVDNRNWSSLCPWQVGVP